MLSVTDGRGRSEISPSLSSITRPIVHPIVNVTSLSEVPHYTYPAITTTSYENPEIHILPHAHDGGADQFRPWPDVGSSPPDSLYVIQSKDES